MRITHVTAYLTALAALVAAGCGSGAPATGGSSDVGDASGSNTDSLTYACIGGIYQDAQVEAFFEPFENETGITVHDDPTLEYAKVRTMVDAGRVTWDGICGEGFWAVEQCEELLLPIDTEIVDLSGIDPELIQSECAAPLLTYLSAIYYNTDTFDDGAHPAGCQDFFDTERFPGTRAAHGTGVPNALLECALLADGVPADELYPIDIDRAFDKIATIKDDLVFWNTGADSEQLISTGEVDLILAWNGRAYGSIAQQDAGFAPAYGESFLHYDAVVVPKGVADPDAAMRLVDFMMDAARQATLTKLIPYAPANRNAELGDLDDDLKEFLPNTNPELASGVVVQDQRWWADNAELVTRRWSEEFQG